MFIAVSRVRYLPKQHTELVAVRATISFRLHKSSLSFSNPKTHSD